jgi:nitroreductase
VNRRQLLMGTGALALTGAGAAYLTIRHMGSMADYASALAPARAALAADPELRGLIRYATLAPSGHNAQPWRFRAQDGGIAILPDLTRRTPVVDPDDHHLFVGLGGAAETLAIAAAARGRAGEVSFSPEKGGAVAVVFGGGRVAEPALFDAIPRRQATRADYDGRPVVAADLRALAAAAAMPGVDLVLICDRTAIQRVSDLVTTGNSTQMADPAFVRELKHWLRFSPRQAARTGDGLFSAASGSPIAPAWAGSALFDLTVHAKAENEAYARQLRSSSGVAVFVGERADPDHWVRVGRAAQRFALAATARGLKLAYINQPIEVPSLRPLLASLIGLRGRRPDLVIRFGHGPAMPYSARRPIASVLA